MDVFLSYFDNMKGPTIRLKTHQSEYSSSMESKILNLMDIKRREVFFEHSHLDENTSFTTGNLLFEIPSPRARGGTRQMMLSVLTDADKDVKHLRKLMNEYAEKISKEADMYKG